MSLSKEAKLKLSTITRPMKRTQALRGADRYFDQQAKLTEHLKVHKQIITARALQ